MNFFKLRFSSTQSYLLALLLCIGCLWGSELKGKESYEYAQAHCKKILEKLWEKQGGQKMPNIVIETIAEYGKPAEYDFRRKTIVIDPKAYTLCLELAGQKEDALAFLIAHELVHAYQHSSLSYVSPGFFVKSQSLKGWAESQKARRKHMESKADIWGAVLCYLAGYNVENNIPRFIEGLYNAFDLNEEDPLYDSKNERLAIANRAKKEVQKALQVYDMAIYLSVLQAHDKDIVLYQYLIDDFKSAEFYNNLGLAYAKLALPMLEDPYRSYPYPFVLDTDTRLEKVPSKGRVTPQKLLLQSISNFNKAIQLNPDYLANRINRACAFHMLSSLTGANNNYYIEQAKADISYVRRYNQKVYPGPEQEILGLHRHAKELEKIILNPSYFQGHSKRKEIPVPACNRISLDQIDLSETSTLGRIRYDWKLNLSFEKGIEFSTKKLSHSRLHAYIDRDKGEGFFLQKVNSYLPSAPTYIFQVGTKIPLSAQSQMRKSVSVLQGDTFLIWDQKALVYKVGIDGRVKEWAIFREI